MSGPRASPRPQASQPRRECRVGPPESGVAPLPPPRMRPVDASPPGNLPASLADRLARQTGPTSQPQPSPGRHQRVTAIGDGPGLRRCPPPTTALVEHGCHRDVFRNDGGLQLLFPLHAANMSEKSTDSNIIAVTVLTKDRQPTPGPTFAAGHLPIFHSRSFEVRTLPPPHSVAIIALRQLTIPLPLPQTGPRTATQTEPAKPAQSAQGIQEEAATGPQ